jgi:hypothetical protein
MKHPVYTVGTEKDYDHGIATMGREFMKTGATKTYVGGFACQSPEDANRLIDDFNMRGRWAVYELEAEWGVHTRQSDNGWYHRLLVDSVILRKVV